ncbi:MAG: hypothetical protein NZ108_01705, partial [Bacteroidia bacterium]|nr:hypothetical protein [Bacteroidia bacterium]
MEALQHLFQNLENEPESIQEEASLIAKEIQETDQVIQEKTQKSNQKLLLMGFALAVVALVTLLQSVGLFHFQGLIALGIGL